MNVLAMPGTPAGKKLLQEWEALKNIVRARGLSQTPTPKDAPRVHELRGPLVIQELHGRDAITAGRLPVDSVERWTDTATVTVSIQGGTVNDSPVQSRAPAYLTAVSLKSEANASRFIPGWIPGFGTTERIAWTVYVDLHEQLENGKALLVKTETSKSGSGNGFETTQKVDLETGEIVHESSRGLH